jgi:RNA-directed DNA polymerase
VLSPLLANVLLDEVDRELERRGHRFVRYADDCNVYVRSPKAGQRVLQALRGCYAKLALKVNESKTAVAEVWGRKFLGYCFWAYKDEAKRAVATQALDKMRERIRQLTRRTRGRSLQQIAEDLRGYVPGWKAYFGLAQTPKVMRELDQWLRHRLRAFNSSSGGAGRRCSASYASWVRAWTWLHASLATQDAGGATAAWG